MMYRYPHVIRLRGFWQREVVQESQQRGCRYCRRFGAPTGLDYHERVWLVCEGVARAATVLLNGEVLGAAASAADFEYDVTSRLQSRNEVCLQFMATDSADAVPSTAADSPARAVRLEIRTTLTLP